MSDESDLTFDYLGPVTWTGQVENDAVQPREKIHRDIFLGYQEHYSHLKHKKKFCEKSKTFPT